MLNKDILSQLSRITPEEEKLLAGKENIDRGIYMAANGKNVVRSAKLLNSGKLITVRPHTRFAHFPKHTHDYIEIVFMCSGCTAHIINGDTVTLNSGELLFIGMDACQEVMPAGRDDIAVNFIILPQFFDTVLPMLGSDDTPIKNFLVDGLGSRKKQLGRGYLHFRVADVPPVQNLVENLLWTLLHNVPNKRNINQVTMGLLFLTLLNHTDRLSVASPTDKAVMHVLSLIETDYRTANLSKIADDMHYDFFALSREIKRQTGKTYTELLQDKRLTQACWLLKNTQMSVADISVAVGYENISYFHRIFKSRYSQSPKKFRDCK